MKTFQIRFFIILVIALLVSVGCYFWLAINMSLPTLDGYETIHSLNNVVIIKYDENAIPYIEAENINDMFLTQGYLMARDRFFQMDIMRHLAKGQLSEIFSNQTIAIDLFNSRFDFESKAKLTYSNLDQKFKNYLDSFTSGVNAYLANNFDKLPVEYLFLNYKPVFWQASDSLAILEYINFQSNNNIDSFKMVNELKDLLNDHSKDLISNKISFKSMPLITKILPDNTNYLNLNLLSGSCAILIDSKYSLNQGNLLAFSKHDKFTNPSYWYLNNLSSKNINLSGFSLVGVPGIVIGRNDNIVFGNVDIKTQSNKYVLEKFYDESSPYYLSPTGWQKAQIISKNIKVRFRKDYICNFLKTRSGIELNRDKNIGVFINNLNDIKESNFLNTIFGLDFANDTKNAIEVVNKYNGSTKQFLISDKNHSFSIVSGLVLNDCQKNDWVMGYQLKDDYYSQRKLERIKTCLIEKYFVAMNGLSIDVLNNLEPVKTIDKLIKSKIDTGYRFCILDLNSINSSSLNFNAQYLIRRMQNLVRQTDSTNNLFEDNSSQLTSFAGNIDGNSKQALVYEVLINNLANNILVEKLGVQNATNYMNNYSGWTSRIIDLIKNENPFWLPKSFKNYDSLLLNAFNDTLIKLKSNDTHKLIWENFHRLNFIYFINSTVFKNNKMTNFLNGKSYNIGFDNDTPKVVNNEVNEKTLVSSASYGEVLNFMVDTAKPEVIYYQMIPGESGNLFSKYNQNLVNNWLQARPLKLYFDKALLNLNLRHKLVLVNR